MKTITNVVLNTNTLSPEAQTLPIAIYGDEGAVFSLIIKKGATHWYDFNASPSAFVTSEKILSNITISPNGSGTYSSVGSSAIEVPSTGSNTPVDFTINVTLGSSDFIKVRDPNDGDFSALKSATVERITEDEETGDLIFTFSDDNYGSGFLKGMQARHSNITGGVTTVKRSYDELKGISFNTTELSVATALLALSYTNG